MAEEELFRRETDRMFAQGLNKCELGINQCYQQLSEIREAMHVGLAALNLQIAKMPQPIPLKELEERFVQRNENEQAERIIAKLIDSFITKEEIRPLKVAIYGLWFSIGATMVAAAITLALK